MLKILAPIFTPPVRAYICRQHERLEPQAKLLTSCDRMGVEKYFRPDILDSVRIIIADPLPIPDPPLASVMHRLGLDLPSPSSIAAITFENVIACRDTLNSSLLFHELVHVVQYHLLGVREFARQYVTGFLETRSYSEIPLERSAFDLQLRFETGTQRFDVEFEIREYLRRR